MPSSTLAGIAFFYARAFLPIQASLFFSSFAEPRAVLYLRFCGAALLESGGAALGLPTGPAGLAARFWRWPSLWPARICSKE